MTSLATGSALCVAAVDAILGEGPLWDPRLARLLFLDIKGERLFSFNPETEKTETHRLDGMGSALGLARQKGYVCVRRDGFALLDIGTKGVALSPIIDPEADQPSNRFNDGKVDPLGGFWAGTMDNGETSVTGAWWRLAPDGEVARLDSGIKVTNGPAFDPDNGKVYLTDSARQVIYVADTDGARLSQKRPFLTFGKGDGYPDGMEVDCDGCLWVAFWDGGVVRRFSLDGALMEVIALPAPRPTSLAFADENLYVTSARIGLDAAALAEAPQSGGLFRVRLARAVGRPAAYFDDRALRR